MSGARDVVRETEALSKNSPRRSRCFSACPVRGKVQPQHFTIVRALAVSDVAPRDAPRIVRRETRTGLVMGLLIAGFDLVLLSLIFDQSIALVVSLKLISSECGISDAGDCTRSRAIRGYRCLLLPEVSRSGITRSEAILAGLGGTEGAGFPCSCRSRQLLRRTSLAEPIQHLSDRHKP